MFNNFSKNHCLKGRRIIILPGAPTYLGPALILTCMLCHNNSQLHPMVTNPLWTLPVFLISSVACHTHRQLRNVLYESRTLDTKCTAGDSVLSHRESQDYNNKILRDCIHSDVSCIIMLRTLQQIMIATDEFITIIALFILRIYFGYTWLIDWLTDSLIMTGKTMSQNCGHQWEYCSSLQVICDHGEAWWWWCRLGITPDSSTRALWQSY
jgi:hypothetical protein